jgi:hypothetical protein
LIWTRSTQSYGTSSNLRRGEGRDNFADRNHGATFPDQTGKPTQTPTARWVFHYLVGIHVLRIPGQWDYLVVNLTEAHQSLLRLLGKPYELLYR